MTNQNEVVVVSIPTRNIVKISYVGHIGVVESKLAERALADAMDSAKPGFCLLTDLSNLTSMDIACVPYISKTMELARSHGVAKVVRIIPDPLKDIGFAIMSLFHYPHHLLIVTCETAAEAEHALT